MANSEWSTEDTYWRENYRSRPYASSGTNDYRVYQPGYRYGCDAANRYSGAAARVEADLESAGILREPRPSTWAQISAASDAGIE